MTTVTTVPFAKLVASDEINARSASKDGIDELAASITAKGLIQPLAVRPADGDKYEIIDGRRRHQALAKLVKAKAFSKTFDVPVIIRHDDDAEALETSLMANTVRLPMHPVDQHEVFARLSEKGQSDSEIAARFGIAEKTVRQHKALSRLAPVVRDAWKKGRIDAPCAKAFALHPDPAVQTAAYEKMKKWPPTEQAVRSELSGTRKSAAGVHDDIIERYVAAGGKISEDLFDDTKFLDNPALLETVTSAWAEDLCAATKAKLLSDGWSWVERAKTLPRDWAYNWPKLDDAIPNDDYEAESRCDGVEPEDADEHAAKFTAEERARTGVVLEMFSNGELTLNFGFMKPGESSGAEFDEGEVPDDDEDDFNDGAPDVDDDTQPSANPFKIPDTLTQTITEAMTIAAQQAVLLDPALAMRIITAALTCRHMAPAAVSNSGHAVVRGQSAEDFATTFKRLLNENETAIAAKFCGAVGSTFDLTHKTWLHKGRDTGIEALRDALPAEAYLDAAREAFNAADYFKRASKAAAIAALQEIAVLGVYPVLSPELPNALKAHLALMASERATATCWLPPELRHPTYALVLPADPRAAAGSTKESRSAQSKKDAAA